MAKILRPVCLMVILALVLSLGLALAPQAKANEAYYGATLVPSAIELTLMPGESASETKTANLEYYEPHLGGLGIASSMIDSIVVDVLTLHVNPESYASWVTWTPPQYNDVIWGETRLFVVTYTVPPDTPPGDYEFDLELIGEVERDSVTGLNVVAELAGAGQILPGQEVLAIQDVTIHVIEEEVAPARIIVRNLLIQPAQAYPGEEVTISADVVNQGGIRVSRDIELVINGQAEQSTRVGVAPGTAQHITFTTSKSVPGTYEVFIEGQASAFNVLLRPQATSDTGTAGGLDTAAIIAIVVIGVIFIVGIIVAFIFVRR
jgi:hypothetical protein